MRVFQVGSTGGRLRRWPVLAAGVLVVAVSGGTWSLAAQARTPSELAGRAKAPAPSVITVAVGWRRLAQTVMLTCQGQRTVRTAVAVPAVEIPEVTRLPLRSGAAVSEGSVVLEVAARPVIALQGALPLFRDLASGVQGADVTEVQDALVRLGFLTSSHVTGTFDTAMASAVTKLYKKAGYSVPGAGASTKTSSPSPSATATTSTTSAVQVPRGEVVVVRQLPATMGVISARLGATLTAGQVVIEGGKVRLACTNNNAGDTSLHNGQRAQVTDPQGRQVNATVRAVAVSAGSADSGTSTVTQTAVLQPGGGDFTVSGSGYQASVVIDQAATVGPVVPASALYTRPGGRTVLILVKGGRTTEIGVTAMLDVDGQVQVRTDNGVNLAAGDLVQVSAANGTIQ